MNGARPMVEVRVGNSKPVPVLLDTGSTGLQIYAPVVNTAPGGGVTVTTKRDSITYAGGHRFVGVVAEPRKLWRAGAVGEHSSDRKTRHAALSAKLRLSATIRQ